MGVINTLREKMGRVVVFAVGISILSFVAADLLGPNSSLTGNGAQNVGEIGGESIGYQEFNAEFDRMKTNYAVSTNENPTTEVQNSLREQAWNNFILKIAYQNEYDKIGLQVTDEEKVDMVQGVNIHPSVVQSFTDPNTGQFDKNRVINFLQNFDQLDQRTQYNWNQFEQSLTPERLQNKMLALIRKSEYVNKYQLEKEHVKKNASAFGNLLYVPYFSIADSTVTVGDDVLKEVLNERKEEFKLEDNIAIDYISYEVVPSASDTAYYTEEMAAIAREFKESLDDSSYIKLNSDEDMLPQYYNGETLPQALSGKISSLDSGDVVGPIMANGTVEIYKYMGTGIDSTGEVVRASHILFKTDNGEDEAKKKANDVLRQLKSGADFAEMARLNSEGPTSTKGGDLGWFGKGRMVPEFDKAVFEADKEGLIPNLIKTTFGYHIINITASKSNTSYLVGKIVREISPSDETRNEVFRKADRFAGTAESMNDFKTQAEEEGLSILNARNIKKTDQQINGITNIREIIRWGFSEASIGEVSPVFEINDNYVIAVLNSKSEEGYASVNDVRERLMPLALKKVKAKEIVSKLDQLTEEDLNDRASSYGSSAKVYPFNNITLNTNTLPGVGFDPAAVGMIFGMETGNVSNSIKGENGVLILQLERLEPALQQDNLTTYKQEILQKNNGRTSLDLSETVKEAAEIEDNRYKYF